MVHLTWNLYYNQSFVFCVVSLLKSEKVVRIKQVTDVITKVLKKRYRAGLINMVSHQHILSIRTFTNILNLSV